MPGTIHNSFRKINKAWTSTDQRIKKIWYTYTVEYYTAIKR
jgi:hypothetical protein